MISKFLRRFGYYKISSLNTGGHCGLCGDWIVNAIFEKTDTWRVDICEKCSRIPKIKKLVDYNKI